MTSIDTASAFAGATNDTNPSAKFYELGTTYKGKVTRIGENTSPNTLKKPPVEETSVIIDIELDTAVNGSNPQTGETFSFDAGDTVTLWCRTHIEGNVVPNGITRAIADAVRAAGKSGLPEVGGTLAIRFDSTGQAKTAGHNPPKIYRAQYQPPVAGSQAGGPFDAPAQAAPAQEVPAAPAAPAPSDDLF